jgi:hypothetical protein
MLVEIVPLKRGQEMAALRLSALPPSSAQRQTAHGIPKEGAFGSCKLAANSRDNTSQEVRRAISRKRAAVLRMM